MMSGVTIRTLGTREAHKALHEVFVDHFITLGGGDPAWFELIFRLAETLSAKNTDYSRGAAKTVEDPYKTFRLSEQLSGANLVQTILVRKADKLARADSLREHAAKVKNESLLITLLDEAAYCIIEMGWHIYSKMEATANAKGTTVDIEELCRETRSLMEKAESLSIVPRDEHPEKDDERSFLRKKQSEIEASQ